MLIYHFINVIMNTMSLTEVFIFDFIWHPGNVQWIGQAPLGVGELSLAAEHSRRIQRADEMGTRLTRVIYGLQQQTRVVQNDIERSTVGHMRPIQKVYLH